MNTKFKGQSQTLCSKSYDRQKKMNLKFLHQKYNDNTFWYSVIASNIQSWMMKNGWINISYIHCDCDDNMAFDKGS